MNVKPIMTRYKGYRFRSRTEARWAVFFDHLGIKFEYEPQGYLLDGVPYLPDFWLPELDCFFEIKGVVADKGELQKCHLLARMSDKNVFLFVGPPADEVDNGLFIWFEPGLGKSIDIETSWIECQVCSCVKPNGYVEDFSCHPADALTVSDEVRRHEHFPKAPIVLKNNRLRTAITAARSARFEFGEEGAN